MAGRGRHVFPIAAEAAEDAAADDLDAAALELAAMEEWLHFGNPNHRVAPEKKSKREKDLMLIAKLKLNYRIHPDELYRYNIVPETLRTLGPSTRDHVENLYETLESTSMTRRCLLQLQIAKQGDTAEARKYRSKIDHDKEILMLEPIELERIKGRKIVKVKEYLLAYPSLLPKMDPNGSKKKKD